MSGGTTTAVPPPKRAAATVDLASCDREPIHVPGAIQPHGALLSFREPDFTIMQVSANVEDHLGREVEELRGRTLGTLLDRTSLDEVRVVLHSGRWEELNPVRVLVGERAFDGIVHRHQGVAILELEPIAEVPEAKSAHHPLRLSLMGLQGARTLAALCQNAVREVRRLSGFERVLLYRFDENGDGAVEAEAKDASLETYLNLHYPASDIPRQARELYLRNWLRIIPDACYTPSPLVPRVRPDTGRPLNLSFAVLRSVSPVHLEYMANMGVRASMSISLIVQDRLWGLISCANHGKPRLLPYHLRSACEVLGRLTSLQIAALEDRELAAVRASRRGTQQTMAEAMRATNLGVEVLEALLERPDDLLHLTAAQGAAVVEQGEVHACGRTPPAALILGLAAWLDARGDAPLFGTARLSEVYPPALEVKDVASGLLTFSLPGVPRRRVMWFRPEMVQNVSWGGDPRKELEADKTGMALRPRRSFDLWKEEVRLTSSPWSAGDLEAADDLRRYALEIDLEHQVARAQQAVRAREDLVAVVSHDLRNPLGVIQMHASLLLRPAAAGDEEGIRRQRASAERIQRTVHRMNALIRDLLDQGKIEAGRFTLQCQPENVRDMIDEALLLLRPLADAKNLLLTGEPIDDGRVLVDRERIFQVLSNLIGNAIKFTPLDGTVIVSAERERGTEGERVPTLFTVADSGPGIPADQLPHVFDRYWQMRNRKSREGSGLGLYIAKGIVEAHGGRIWVELPPRGGSAFRFTLPGC